MSASTQILLLGGVWALWVLWVLSLVRVSAERMRRLAELGIEAPMEVVSKPLPMGDLGLNHVAQLAA
eukprot:11694717-Alexandrium_andersonii.AAC.1